MGSWTIYSKNRTPKYTVKELEYHDTWMGEEYVTVSITSPTPLELAIGDYLIYRGLTYSVYSVPGALKQARKNTYGEAFKYDNVKLSSRGTELTDIRFLDYVPDDNNIHYTSLPTFAFYAETVDDLLDRLQANTDREGVQWLFISPSYNRTMQRYEQGTPAYQEAAQLWEQYFGGSHEDPVYEKTNVNISIDKQSVWDGLAPIKNDFGLNFFSRERAVIVGGEGMPAEHVFQYGKGNGLYQIERIADQDQKVTTKLYAYGSDKNLPIRYYANITRICFAYLYARPSVDSNILYLDFVWNRSYVTGAADSDGKFPVVVSIAGVTYNVKAYPMEVGARTLFTIEASVSLGFVTRSMEIDFVSGIDKDKFPASNVRQESGALPNNMAVQVLMLPGFPQYSLADLCRCTYNGEQTVLEIRKTPSESYNEFMRIEGNHPVTFSNDPLQPYILSGNVETIGIKEGDVHFVEDNDDNGLKEIFPSIEEMTRGDVEGTSSTERLDEIVSCDVIQDNGVFGEGVKIENFNLVLKDIGFDLKEAFDNAGGNMTLSMKDGYCGGRDFNVHSVTSIANGQWRLNVERSHDEGLDLWFPYSTNAAIGQTPTADEPYQIRTGDHFVLTEIEIGDTSYIWAAAMKMLRKSITYLLNNDYTRFTYLPKVDEIYMARQHDESQTQAGIESLHDTLKSGMLMLFEDEDLDVDGSVFIDSLTIKENGNNGIPTYDVVLRNDKQVGTMQRIQNQINSLTSYIGSGGGGLSVSQIRSLINTYGGELFLSKVNADIAAGRITFQQGLEALMLSVFNGIRNNGRITSDEADIPRFVSDTTIDGILHVMAKIVANQIESDNFNGDGPFDTGFELTKSDGNGYSLLVVDKLYVRLKAIFNELEIRKISYSGGNFIFSHAGSHIVYVKELQLGVESEVEGTVLKLSGDVDVADNVLNVGSGSVSDSTLTLSSDKRVYAYRCYIMKDDGTTATENWWRVDDQARCQTFNVVEPGHYENIENTSYWRRVIAVGHEKVRLNDSEQEQEYDYVDLSLIDCMQGSDTPKAGDQIVQMGNRTDVERQGFISLEVAGEYAPAFKVYKGVNGYTLDGKRKICISPKLSDIRAQKFIIETEYDARQMPMERGDWSKIPEHKCYYYNIAQHNGGSWLCVCPEGEYTTEEPSETATYWRPYAEKGKDGNDGADSVTTTLSTQTVEIPTDTDGVCLEDTQVELSAQLFIGNREIKVTDIVVDEQSSQRVTSVVKSTLDMMPWATSSDASVQGNVITFSRNASVQGAVLTIGGDAFNVTPSKVVVTIANGTVVDEHTVNLRVTGVDEDKTTHYGFAAFNVQRHYIPVNGQNIIVTPAALIVNQSLQNPDNLSQLSEEIIFSATMGERQVAVNKVEITSTDHCTVEGSNGNKATVRAIGTYTEEGSNYYYDKANFICKVTTAYGTIEGIKVDVYANLLGTWKETVEADTKTEVARSLTYGYDPESGEVISLENFGSFIKSSEENISTISRQINDPTTGLVTQISTIDQKADRISLSVESKENTNLVPDPDIYQMLTTSIERIVSLKKDRKYTLTARLKNTATSSITCGIEVLTVTTMGCVLNAGETKNFSKTFTAPASGDFTIRVPQTAAVQLQWLQLEQGEAYTQHNTISSAFKRTGIDIENGTINLQADKVAFYDSSGSVSPYIELTSDGKIKATEVDLSGKISATSGAIGGFVIGEHLIKSNNNKIILNDDGTGIIGGFSIGEKELKNTAYDASIVIQNAASNPTQIARIGKSAVDSMTNKSCSLQAESKGSGTYNTALYLNAIGAKYNYAFHGNGNGVLNGLMFGYKTQYKTIPSGSIDRLDYIYLKDGATTILKGTHSSGHVIMASPSISEVRQCLGLSTSDTTTPFAIEVTYINLSDYTEVHIGFRGNTTGGELGAEYPFLMNNDNHFWATSLQIAKGDLMKLMLLYAPSSYGTGAYEYRAQVVVRQADV